MSDRYFICCEQCFDKIAKRSTPATRLWMDLCAQECHSGLINIHFRDSSPLRTLEKAGFVITTDKSDHVIVKIIGRMETDDGEPFFCSKEGMHDE